MSEELSRSEDSRQTAKTAVLNTIANGIALVVGMVMVPIIARIISQEELGIASTFLANRNIFVIVITLAVYSYVHKAMLEFRDEKKNYIFSVSVFCVAMTGLAFLVCLPFKSRLQALLSMDDFLYYWLFLSILSFALYNIAYYYCVFHNKYIIVFAIVMSVGPLSQFVSVFLAHVMSDRKYIGRVIGLDSLYVIVAVCLIVWLLVSGKKSFRGKYLSGTLRFTVPVIPHLLSQMVLTQCDLIMISYYCGDDKSGIYSMGHTVGYLALTAVLQLMASWSPWVYRRLEGKETDSIKQNSGLMVLLGAYLSIGLMTVAPELIRIFLPKEYLPCIYILPPLIAAMFFQFIYLFFYDLEYYYKKPVWIATASVIAAVLNLILNKIFIVRYGYVAACYTTFVSYFVLLAVSWLFAGRLNAAKIYNLKSMVAAIAGVVIYMILMFVFSDIIWVRYMLLVALSAVIFIREKNRLLGLWRGMRSGV